MSANLDLARSVRPPPSERLTYEAFLDWCDEDTLAEWIDGEVLMASPASERHADLGSFLLAVLRFWADDSRLGKVYAAPFQMRLPEPQRRGREPDILFVRAEHRDRLRNTYLDGAADLVVEIISPESVGRDRGEKFVEYEQAGVEEYWLIDPDRRQAEFYQLGPDGRYHLVLGGARGEYRSEVLPDFRLSVDWLWQDPLPRVSEVVRALGFAS
ncbi:MAG: Uma2 family endonuclease [Chloroflexota bacterium]